jgi:hypothetical protein
LPLIKENRPILKVSTHIALFIILIFISITGFAQNLGSSGDPVQTDSIAPNNNALLRRMTTKQTDIMDVGRNILKKGAQPRPQKINHTAGKLEISPLVAPTYTPQTEFGALIGTELAFYTDSSQQQNISSILTSFNYTQLKQSIFPIESNIWLKHNKYNIVTDWRYLNYPSQTFGLGGGTPLANGYYLDYYYLRLHQSIFKTIAKNTYLGLGYYFDHYWDIDELNANGGDSSGGKTDFDTYGFSKNATASGLVLGFLYDSRRNSINPDQGAYLNLTYRNNFAFLGSNSNWESLLVEFKKYQKFPSGSNNIIALWSYDWLTLSGNPPYLLLPSTGWDAYWNAGRGYTQGRFRGKNMLYLETEYRFQITSNGLLGGVLFANAQSFTEPVTNKFEYLQPGYGLGLRIKLNKNSKTNFCVDYGWGAPGNKGFALNIGEVF